MTALYITLTLIVGLSAGYLWGADAEQRRNKAYIAKLVDRLRAEKIARFKAEEVNRRDQSRNNPL